MKTKWLALNVGRSNFVTYVPSTPGCSPAQNQMWDVLLLVSPPLKDRREFVTKVSIRMQKCVKKHSHRIS